MNKQKLRKEAIKLIYHFKEEEQSDLDCCLIANNSLKDGQDEISWKKERINIFNFIIQELQKGSFKEE